MARCRLMEASALAKAMHGKMTDQQLADEVGVDRSFITRVRLRQRKPSLALAIKIANRLKMPVEALSGQDAA